MLERFGRALVKGIKFGIEPANREATLEHAKLGNPQQLEDMEFANALLDVYFNLTAPIDPGKGYGYQDPASWELWQKTLVASGDLDGAAARPDQGILEPVRGSVERGVMSSTTIAAASESRPTPIYELTNVCKYYGDGDVIALEGVDLTLSKGEFHSVIGSSGCGKSTLLKIMAGLTPPSKGRVILSGTPVKGARPDIGMMFQQATLFPWRTTMQNVMLPIEIREGRDAADAARPRALALLELVGLKGFENYLSVAIVRWHGPAGSDLPHAGLGSGGAAPRRAFQRAR